MFGILFFFIAFCAWLAKQSDEHDKYYADYKKKGMDKFGCWKDGHNGWHLGNKELANFIIAGHNVAAVPDHLSYYQYDFHKWKYIVRDFTLEEEIQREVAEIKGFYADMAAKQKAIEEEKMYYKPTTKFNEFGKIYRKVNDNTLYSLTDYRNGCVEITNYKANYLNRSTDKLSIDEIASEFKSMNNTERYNYEQTWGYMDMAFH